MSLEFEHIIPEVAGGSTIRENLWLACRRCNQFKGDRIQAIDPQTSELVSLFNPRAQHWADHFSWQPNGRPYCRFDSVWPGHGRSFTNEPRAHCRNPAFLGRGQLVAAGRLSNAYIEQIGN